MPWYKQQYDLSLLEVNRYVCVLSATVRNLSHIILPCCWKSLTIICQCLPQKLCLWNHTCIHDYFSKETLVAVVTNIEGREWRRIEGIKQWQATWTSKDEQYRWCGMLFQCLADTIGCNFTTKQVRFGFRKACVEFKKRLDPDLPFYYHTSSHSHFFLKVPFLISMCPTPKRNGSFEQHHVNSLLILLPDVQLCQFEGAYQLDHSSITSHLNYPYSNWSNSCSWTLLCVVT